MNTTIDYATLFSGVETQIVNAISATVPVVVPILGITLAIAYGIKLFRKISH